MRKPPEHEYVADSKTVTRAMTLGTDIDATYLPPASREPSLLAFATYVLLSIARHYCITSSFNRVSNEQALLSLTTKIRTRDHNWHLTIVLQVMVKKLSLLQNSPLILILRRPTITVDQQLQLTTHTSSSKPSCFNTCLQPKRPGFHMSDDSLQRYDTTITELNCIFYTFATSIMIALKSYSISAP